MTSCTEYLTDVESFLNGESKTPVTVRTNLSVGSATGSRAVDKTFEGNEVLIARLQTVEAGGTVNYSKTEQFTIAANPNHTAKTDDINQTSDLTCTTVGASDGKIYWDDYSSTAYDLREKNSSDQFVRGLRYYYGYCYNGGTPTTALDEAAGTIGWTIATDQTSGFKTSDLLFGDTQAAIHYTHSKEAEREVLELPYTHAMSKVTVEIVCDEEAGFKDVAANFANTTVDLQGINTVATVTAPTATVVPVPGDGNANVKTIQTLPIANNNLRKSFSAIIVPTVMKEGKLLAKINDVDGNNYELNLTDAILDTDETNDWASQLTGYSADDGGMTKPGVHYLITVTIQKQAITLKATIKDWDEVSAQGVGVIQFDNDITTKGNLDQQTLKDNGFDVYQKNIEEPAYSKVTTYSYTSEPAAWTRTDEIYWPNKTDRFYFRALSGAKPDDTDTPANESLTMTNGKDVLWGTTKEHKGPEVEEPYSLDYKEGDPIAPRTGDVPLVFYHPMAKITVNLVDANASKGVPEGVGATDYTNPLNPRLNLAGAKIEITNMSTSGTINLHDGSITPTTPVAAKMFNTIYYAANDADTKTPQVEQYIVTPQTFEDDAYMIITLADGTTYRLKLNECEADTGEKDADDKPIYENITKWERGKHYVYTITLDKQKITFRAMIKDWVETTGGGIANLEWD